MRPAGRLDERPRSSLSSIEPVESRISVRLQDAGIARKVTLWVFPRAVARVVEHGRRAASWSTNGDATALTFDVTKETTTLYAL